MRRGAKRAGALAAAVGVLAAAGPAGAQAQGVQLVPFGGQEYSSPYFVSAPPGDPDRLFVVEGAGTIRLVESGVTQATPFLSIPADVLDADESGCECGMFSMAPAPDYASSGLFYVFYTRDDPTPGNDHFLRIEEFRRSASNPDVADPATRRLVLELDHLTASNHNGGQLQFGPDGMLYISTGDGGNTPLAAQSLTSRLGKLLRIDPRGAAPGQYSIPPGNPLADGPGGNADEIYAYGLRNPYRFSFDRSTGDLTIGDVGGGAWEEADLKREGGGSGANFGWPCFEGNHTRMTSGPCSPPLTNHSPPALEYANPPAGAAAISGGYVIRDPALPSLAGRYLYADTYGAVPGIRSALLSETGSSGDASLGVSTPNPVSFGQDSCGHLYVVSIAGVVSRLQPTAGPFPCKLGPQLSMDASGSSQARKSGALVAGLRCDEDCAATATGSIRVRAKGKRKGFTLAAKPASAPLQLGVTTTVRLDLAPKQRKRLARALKTGRKAFANVEAAASGGGGGLTPAVQTVRVARRAPK